MPTLTTSKGNCSNSEIVGTILVIQITSFIKRAFMEVLSFIFFQLAFGSFSYFYQL